MTTSSEQWNSQQPKKRRRRRGKRASVGTVWPLMVTSGCCRKHPEKWRGLWDEGRDISEYTPAMMSEAESVVNIITVVNVQVWSLSAPVSWEYEALHHGPWRTTCSLGWTLRRNLQTPVAPPHRLNRERGRHALQWETMGGEGKHLDYRNKYLYLTDMSDKERCGASEAGTLMHLLSKVSLPWLSIKDINFVSVFVWCATHLGSPLNRFPNQFPQNPWKSGGK